MSARQIRVCDDDNDDDERLPKGELVEGKVEVESKGKVEL